MDRMVNSAKLNGDAFQSLKDDPTVTSETVVLAFAGASFGVGFAASIGYSTSEFFLEQYSAQSWALPYAPSGYP
jgi:hypothetical protein